MFLHDEDTPSSPASRSFVPSPMRKWYDTAVFFLEKADYLRVPTLMTVQTIAILGIVFNNVGDFHFHHNLWGVAVRTAQTIKINNEQYLASRHPIEREVCRRVWWTLTICDWFIFTLSFRKKKKNKLTNILGCHCHRELPRFWNKISTSIYRPLKTTMSWLGPNFARPATLGKSTITSS